MAFDLGSTLNSIRIRDQRAAGHFTLFARDPTPKEQLAYAQEAISVHKGGVVQNHVRRTRLKYGALLTEKCQAAETAGDEGYGFFSWIQEDGGARKSWVPLTPEAADLPVDIDQVFAEYAALHGEEWAGWIRKLPAWKALLVARAPMHLEAVASTIFEGSAEVAPVVEEESLPNA